MNKIYYNEMIEKNINFLMELKEVYVEEISSIASTFEYHDINDNVDLDSLDITAINKRRQRIFCIYELISNLEKLKK